MLTASTCPRKCVPPPPRAASPGMALSLLGMAGLGQKRGAGPKVQLSVGWEDVG